MKVRNTTVYCWIEKITLGKLKLHLGELIEKILIKNVNKDLKRLKFDVFAKKKICSKFEF